MKKYMVNLVAAWFFITTGFSQKLPRPSMRQLVWQQMETTAFLHFTVNTFTDKEWGDGTESEKIFNPTKLDNLVLSKFNSLTNYTSLTVINLS